MFEWAGKSSAIFRPFKLVLFLITGAAGGNRDEELAARTAKVNLEMNWLAAQ